MHPSEVDLSLFAGGELSWPKRWTVAHHVKGCRCCQAIVEDSQKASELLREGFDCMPEGVNWNRLAAEMTGNIRVGVAAGECVSPIVGRGERLGWRPALALASASLLIVTAWWLNIPPTHRNGSLNGPRSGIVRSMAPGVTLRSTASAIEVQHNGSELSLTHPKGNEGTTIYATAPGSVRVSYVDQETGQVMINKVYSD